LGLFKIEKILGLINYQLLLLKIMNIYLVFYILFFELALFEMLKILIIEINLVNLNIKYKVEIVLNC